MKNFYMSFWNFWKVKTSNLFQQIYSFPNILKGELNQMEFTQYKITETLEYMFYQVPMELFFNSNYKNNLSQEAKILYGLLTLSIKNNWQDENGDVYIILTREKVQKMLNISDKTATKAFKQLNKCKLIYEKKQGQTKPNLIYVGKIKHNDTIPNMIRKNYDSRVRKNTIHDSENLQPNYIKTTIIELIGIFQILNKEIMKTVH